MRPAERQSVGGPGGLDFAREQVPFPIPQASGARTSIAIAMAQDMAGPSPFAGSIGARGINGTNASITGHAFMSSSSRPSAPRTTVGTGLYEHKRNDFCIWMNISHIFCRRVQDAAVARADDERPDVN